MLEWMRLNAASLTLPAGAWAASRQAGAHVELERPPAAPRTGCVRGVGCASAAYSTVAAAVAVYNTVSSKRARPGMDDKFTNFLVRGALRSCPRLQFNFNLVSLLLVT